MGGGLTTGGHGSPTSTQEPVDTTVVVEAFIDIGMFGVTLVVE